LKLRFNLTNVLL